MHKTTCIGQESPGRKGFRIHLTYMILSLGMLFLPIIAMLCLSTDEPVFSVFDFMLKVVGTMVQVLCCMYVCVYVCLLQ